MGCIFCEDFQKVKGLNLLVRRLCPLSTSSSYGLEYGTSCIACIKMKPLEVQIVRANQMLDDLLEQHRQLRTRMNQSHNHIILGLPREVVSMIFQYTLPATPNSIFDLDRFEVESQRRAAAAPLILGAVCQDWRRIAWSTPQLWTYIRVRLDPWDIASHTNLTQEWIKRSGGLPLSLHVYIRNSLYRPGPPPSDQHIDNLINIVVTQTANRWKTLNLRNISRRIISKVICNSSTFLPMLSSLRIQGSGANDRYTASFGAQNARTSPYNIYIADIRLRSIDIKWNNATRVELSDLQLDDCLEVLKLAPRIQDLKLCDILPVDEEDFRSPIVHHNLQTFALLRPIEPLSLFLDLVRFPALETLDIGMDGEPLPVADISSFFQRSPCRLKRLTIKDTDFENDGLISLLFELPSIVELDLLPVPYSNHSPSVLFKFLASSSIRASDDDGREFGESSSFLPNLRMLKYQLIKKPSWDEPGEDKFSWNLIPPVFGSLSELNNPRRRPFQSLQLHFDRDDMEDDLVIIEEEYIDSLLSILAAGLELDITYPDEGLEVIQYSIEHHLFT